MKHQGIWWVVVLALAIVAPVSGLVVVGVFVPDSLNRASEVPAPITMPVIEQSDAQAVGVKASLTWTPGPTLVAPNWTGLVTSVDVQVGDVVSSGTPVVRIDGVPRVGFASTSPFYRPLSTGMTGADVQMLRDGLSGLGIGNVGSGAVYDSTLQRAVKTFQAIFLGAGGAKVDGAFDPAMVIFLPVPDVTVATVHVQVGMTAPTQGQVIVDSASVLQAFQMTPADTSVGARGLPAQSDGYVLVVNRSQPVEVGEGFTLSDRASLDSVAQALPDHPDSLLGEVRLADARVFAAVPTTSIVTGGDGGLCVFTPSASGTLVSYPVVVEGGLPGVTEVSGLDASVTSVVANPGELGLKGCTTK